MNFSSGSPGTYENAGASCSPIPPWHCEHTSIWRSRGNAAGLTIECALPAGAAALHSLTGRVLAPRPVAPFAGNAQNKPGLPVVVLRFSGGHRRKVGGVTFQAARHNRPAEIRDPIGKSRAVHPPVQFRPIRNRQLKQLIALPIQIRLPLFAGARNDVDAFALRFLVRRLPEHRGFVKTIFASVHAEAQVRIARRKHVGAGREAACDGVFAGKLRSQLVRSMNVSVGDRRVALLAHRIANKIASRRSQPVRS